MKTSRLLVGETDFSTTYQVMIRSVVPSFPSPASRSSLPSMPRWDGFGSRLLMPPTVETALIYVVDDAECVSELYAHFLKGTGYTARIFNDRAAALTALKADRSKPDLLITDYLGDPMPIDRFMQRCLALHPALRVLLASGLSESDMPPFCVKPDRYLQKPFTAEEFLQEIRAALAA